MIKKERRKKNTKIDNFVPPILGCIQMTWACFWQVSWESDWCGCNSVCQSFLLVCASSSMVEHDNAWPWNSFLTAWVQMAVISVTCMWSTYDSAVLFRRLLKRGKITVTHLLWKHTIMPDSFDYMTHSPHKMKLRVWGRETHCSLSASI